MENVGGIGILETAFAALGYSGAKGTGDDNLNKLFVSSGETAQGSVPQSRT